MHFITDTLLVGNINDISQPPPQINAVLQVAAEFTARPPSQLLSGRVPFPEYAEAEPQLLDQAVSWVERHHPGNRVIICCRAGMSRSVSVVMAYLCCVQGMTYVEVLQLVRTQRPGAMPLPRLEAVIKQVGRLREARAKDKQGSMPYPASGS
ncbi:MAG: hypothetical protein JW388_0308 [Nitrospira sp.]|nr:hypothetical protein [Nitrospira sp.]